MNHLRRNCPISDIAWREIDAEATRGLRRFSPRASSSK